MNGFAAQRLTRNLNNWSDATLSALSHNLDLSGRFLLTAGRLLSFKEGAQSHLMPSSCAQCGAEFFPQDTVWTACADCLAAHLELLMGVGRRERMPMKRAAGRNADLGDVTITVQPAHRDAA